MRQLWKSLLLNRALIWQLTKRDFTGRYKGSWLGLLWALLAPVATLGLYAFVFGLVLGVRWQRPQTATGTDFIGPMFAGMIVFLFIADCIARAPTLVIGHADLVKKVAFPVETLCAALVCTALIQAMISLALLWLWCLATGGETGWQFLATALAWVPLILFGLGTTLFLAALGVFVRDIAHVTGFLNSALLLLSPIMYPLTVVPESFRPIVSANPLTPFVEVLRATTIFDQPPALLHVILIAAIGLMSLFTGWYVFHRAQPAFVDVL